MKSNLKWFGLFSINACCLVAAGLYIQSYKLPDTAQNFKSLNQAIEHASNLEFDWVLIQHRQTVCSKNSLKQVI